MNQLVIYFPFMYDKLSELIIHDSKLHKCLHYHITKTDHVDMKPDEWLRIYGNEIKVDNFCDILYCRDYCEMAKQIIDIVNVGKEMTDNLTKEKQELIDKINSLSEGELAININNIGPIPKGALRRLLVSDIDLFTKIGKYKGMTKDNIDYAFENYQDFLITHIKGGLKMSELFDIVMKHNTEKSITTIKNIIRDVFNK